MSKFWKTLFGTLYVKISPSTACHSQTDGQTEIVKRKLEEVIHCLVNYEKDNWDEHLAEFEDVYGTSVHSSAGHTLFFLNCGIHPRTIPAELIFHPPPSFYTIISL